MKIITNPDILHRKCESISYEDSLEVSNKMKIWLLSNKNISNNTLGLACNQLGLEGRVAIYKKNNKWFSLINPFILEKSDDMITTKEACLSVPGNSISIERHKSIVVYSEIDGGKGYETIPNPSESIVIQHELEHLDGILISDYIKEK